ncbi:MAG: Ldh family oxidoreductase [Patescibacteria group bacterium]|nr:Ldh family oxidoreductase [Patescibacteria group bacterium]
MKVKIEELRLRLIAYLRKLDIKEEDASFLADCYIDSEITGRESHGVWKLLWESQYFKEKLGEPKIEKEFKATIFLNGNKQIGDLAIRNAIFLSINKAREYGISLVSIYNIQRIGSLRPLVKLFSSANYIGLLMNSSEAVVSPAVGYKGITGTNPLAAFIPGERPLVIDYATSKKAMANTWLACKLRENLPEETFLDDKGSYTVLPESAKYVEVFGGRKGFALSVLIEILTSGLTIGRSSVSKKSKYDLGYLILCINPYGFLMFDNLMKSVQDLRNSFSESKVNDFVAEKVYLPGDHAEELSLQAKNKVFVSISSEVYEMLFK